MVEYRYSKNGEWVSQEGGRWLVGLTVPAAEELGDVTFAELPALGRTVVSGEAVCTIEAVKAAADFYSPVGGTVTEVNNRLTADPTILNTDPEGAGWIYALGSVSPADWDSLMDPAARALWEKGR